MCLYPPKNQQSKISQGLSLPPACHHGKENFFEYLLSAGHLSSLEVSS